MENPWVFHWIPWWFYINKSFCKVLEENRLATKRIFHPCRLRMRSPREMPTVLPQLRGPTHAGCTPWPKTHRLPRLCSLAKLDITGPQLRGSQENMVNIGEEKFGIIWIYEDLTGKNVDLRIVDSQETIEENGGFKGFNEKNNRNLKDFKKKSSVVSMVR